MPLVRLPQSNRKIARAGQATKEVCVLFKLRVSHVGSAMLAQVLPLCVLAGCSHGHSGQKPAAMVSEPAKSPPVALALPVPAEAGYQARVGVGQGAVSEDHWVDLFVPGTSEEARAACEQALQSVMGIWETTDAGASVMRPCALEPLPARMQQGAPAMVLVHEDAGAGPFIFMRSLMQGELAFDAASELPVTVTTYTRFGSSDECQSFIARIAQHREAAAREAASSAAEWLKQQLAENEQAREVSCGQAAEARSRCEPLRKGGAANKACEADPAAVACKQAKRRNEKLMRCEVERESSERSCANATKLLELVRTQGLGEPPVAEPVKARCIPG